MNVYLKSLGCRLNEAELEQWTAGFLAAGCRVAAEPDGTDLIVVNTCAVTGEAARKSRQIIRRARRAAPTAKLVVTGCDATLNPDLRAEIAGIDLLVHNRDKDSLVDMIRRELLPQSLPGDEEHPSEVALYARGRSRAFVKVQDGCRHRCAFCIVTVARGIERSRPAIEIVDEIRALAETGIKEVVLTGVHLGGYGTDLGIDLATLIRRVLNESGISRLRLGSLEPWDPAADFLDLFEDPRMMPHLHLPLQSGSDTVLRRMARRTRTRDYARLVDAARSRVADLNITTDVIVGFPGETDPEWNKSAAFIRHIGFAHVHIFPYSRREGTRAAMMPDQVCEPVRRARVRELHELAHSMKTEFRSRFYGRTLPVLIESTGDASIIGGYTPNYLPVRIARPAGASLHNEIVDIKISSQSTSEDAVLGELP